MKTFQNIVQDEVNLLWILLEYMFYVLVLEYSLNFMSKNQHGLCTPTQSFRKKILKDPGLIARSLFSDIAKFYCALFTPYHVNNKDLDLAACCILANFQSWWQKIMACICGLIFMLIIMFLPSPSDWLANFCEGVRDQWKKKHFIGVVTDMFNLVLLFRNYINQ